MPPAPLYRYIVASEAFEALEPEWTRAREALTETFRFLAANPFLKSDYQEDDDEHGCVDVILRHRFVFTYYVDHAVKEVRVIRVDRL